MTSLVLRRVKQNDFATYGELASDDGKEHYVTLELPWHENQHNISCIPAGTYTAERFFSPHHGYVVFRLLNVPGRDFVELHIANLPCDLLGCIGIGQQFGHVEKTTGEKGDGILASRAAFQSFMANHPEQRFQLTVVDVPPVTLAA